MANRIEPLFVDHDSFPEFDELLEKYHEAKRLEAKYKDDALIVMNQLRELIAYDSSRKGTERYQSDKFMVEFKVGESYKVDTKKAFQTAMEHQYSVSDLMGMFKFELKAQKEFKALPEEIKNQFEDAVEVTLSSPTITVTKIY